MDSKPIYKVQVIADSTGKWIDNGLKFKTIEDAEEYAENLAARWSAVLQWRVIDPSRPIPETHMELRR